MGIVKSSDEQGFDTGEVVFYEHPQFTDYCVLSLAGRENLIYTIVPT